MKWLGVGRLAVVVSMAWVAGTQAADVTYTLRVPVDLKAIPEQIVNARVYCRLSSLALYEQRELVAEKGVAIPLLAGAYSGVIEVPFTLPSESAIKVRSYSCTISLNDGSNGNGPWAENASSCVDNTGDRLWYCNRPGSPFVRYVTGNGFSGGGER